MLDIHSDYNPVIPAGSTLLAELGIDIASARDALADDRARRCPDRDAPTDESWRKASSG